MRYKRFPDTNVQSLDTPQLLQAKDEKRAKDILASIGSKATI